MKFIFKKIIYLIHIVCFTGLLVTYLSGYINAENFPIFSIFSFTQLFWFVANILLLIYWIVARRKYAIYTFLLLLLGFNHLKATYNFTKKNTVTLDEKQGTYNFAFFNTRVQSIYDKGNTTQQIAKYGITNDIDILGMVEWLNDSKEFANTSYPHQRFVALNPKKPNKGFGLKFVSRYKIIDYKRINYGFPSFNMGAYFDVEFPNQVVRVFVLHLQSNLISGDDYRIAKELGISLEGKDHAFFILKKVLNATILRAKQTQIIKEEIQSSPYPSIIMGDFNDTHLSYTYRQLRENKKDCFVECGKGLGPTFIKPKPFLRIDYILIDQDMHCLDYRTTREIDSDHKLIQTKIAF